MAPVTDSSALNNLSGPECLKVRRSSAWALRRGGTVIKYSLASLYSQCALKIHNLLRQTQHRLAPSARSADTVGLSVRSSSCGGGIHKNGGCLCALWPNQGCNSGKQAQLRLTPTKKKELKNTLNIWKECNCQAVNNICTIETASSNFGFGGI